MFTTYAVWLYGPEVNQHSHQARSTATPAANGQIFGPLGLSFVVQLWQRQRVVTVEAVQLVGRVDVFAAWAVDIGHEQPRPVFLDLAVGLLFDLHHLVAVRPASLASFGLGIP